MKKTILFLYSGECYKLPPFLAILDALHDDYHIKVLSYETQQQKESLQKAYSDVEFLSKSIRPVAESFTDKVIRHIYYPVKYHQEVKKLLNETQYDLLWVIHEHTLLEFQNVLKGLKYIVSFYELNDHDMPFIEKTQKGVQNAMHVISCEYNRSCIMRVWYHLNYTPSVIPNKPFSHPRTRNIPCQFSEQLKNKKIIIFQGYIQKTRNIDKLCEAVKDMPEYTLVLMGGGDEVYINELKTRYSNLFFTGFVNPPHHLDITSYARIGIVKYDHIYLDHSFCAPNKIWEYSGFGIPTLGNDLPGLEYTIGQAGAGLCVNFDDVVAIKKGIVDIERNYDEMSENAVKFYESFDLKTSLNAIIKKKL